jgi:hypothetical protein
MGLVTDIQQEISFMKFAASCLLFAAMVLSTPLASRAASVTSTKVLNSSAVTSDLQAAPVAPYGGGTLTVTVLTTANAPSNPAIFVGLDSVAIGTVGASDLIGGSLPGVATLSRVFAISASNLAAILADSQVLFKFKSSSASERNPYTVRAVLSYAAIPEPTSMAILGLGTCALVGFARRRK